MREAESASTIARAADMGIAGYVDSWEPEDVQGAIDVALRRHREEQRLHEKVEQLESALDRRALIERAKGILMERHGVDDRAAFELLRDHARSQPRRVRRRRAGRARRPRVCSLSAAGALGQQADKLVNER